MSGPGWWGGGRRGGCCRWRRPGGRRGVAGVAVGCRKLSLGVGLGGGVGVAAPQRGLGGYKLAPHVLGRRRQEVLAAALVLPTTALDNGGLDIGGADLVRLATRVDPVADVVVQ